MSSFVLKVVLTIDPTHPVDADGITDLIEILTDELDDRGMEPDIGTHYSGTGAITLDVWLHLAAADALVAQTVGSEALAAALAAAAVEHPSPFPGLPASMQAETTPALALA